MTSSDTGAGGLNSTLLPSLLLRLPLLLARGCTGAQPDWAKPGVAQIVLRLGGRREECWEEVYAVKGVRVTAELRCCGSRRVSGRGEGGRRGWQGGGGAGPREARRQA